MQDFAVERQREREELNIERDEEGSEISERIPRQVDLACSSLGVRSQSHVVLGGNHITNEEVKSASDILTLLVSEVDPRRPTILQPRRRAPRDEEGKLTFLGQSWHFAILRDSQINSTLIFPSNPRRRSTPPPIST